MKIRETLEQQVLLKRRCPARMKIASGCFEQSRRQGHFLNIVLYFVFVKAKIHHKSAHLNKKEMCPLCGGWYKSLYTHIHQIHRSEKKHVCDQCGKAFGKKHDLKVHKDRIHLLRRYICPKCGKTISKIREHLKAVHNVTEPINLDDLKDIQVDLKSVSLESSTLSSQIKVPAEEKTGTANLPGWTPD